MEGRREEGEGEEGRKGGMEVGKKGRVEEGERKESRELSPHLTLKKGQR